MTPRDTLVQIQTAQGAPPLSVDDLDVLADADEQAAVADFLSQATPAKMGLILVSIARNDHAPPPSRVAAAAKAVELWREVAGTVRIEPDPDAED